MKHSNAKRSSREDAPVEDRSEKKRGILSIALFIFLGGLCALIAVAAALLNSDSFKEYIREELIYLARRQGLSLSLESASCSISGCAINNSSLFIPDMLLMVKVANLNVSPKLVSVLLGSPEFDLAGSVYGGGFEGSVSYLNGRNMEGSIKARSLQAKEIPQLSAFGFSSGTVNLELASLSHKGDSVSFQRGLLRAEGLAKPGRTSQLLPIGAGGLTIDIPPITGGALTLDTALENNKLKIVVVDVQSSLFSANGQGEVSMAKNPSVVFVAKVTLSDAGLREAGPILPLMSQGALTQNSKSFEVRVEGLISEPKVRFSPSA